MIELTAESKKVLADAELKVTMEELKATYGYAPGKDVDLPEMELRYKTLSDTLEKKLDDYVNHVGERPDVMRATHTVRHNEDFPQKKMNDLEIYANISDTVLNKAPLTTQEGMANLLLFNIEHILRLHEKAEIENRTAKEWRMIERGYIRRSTFTLMDLYSDYKDLIEDGKATWSDYRDERKKWKKCRHRFCLNMFPVDETNFKGFRKKKKGARYCCITCNNDEQYARDCYAKTSKLFANPTYLPDHFYKDVTEEWKVKRTKQNEIVLGADTVQDIASGAVKVKITPSIKEEDIPKYPCITRVGVSPEQLEAEKWVESKNIRRICQESTENIPLLIERVEGSPEKSPIIFRKECTEKEGNKWIQQNLRLLG